MKEKILDILAENYPEIDFESSDELVDDGTLDSLTVVGIISVLSAEFDVELPYEEIVPEQRAPDLFYFPVYVCAGIIWRSRSGIKQECRWCVCL